MTMDDGHWNNPCTEDDLIARIQDARLLPHQQNFGAQLTYLLRMARVCKPKEIISELKVIK